MKKVLALALSAAVCFSLCSCGGKPSDSRTPEDSSAPMQGAEPTPEPAVPVAAELYPASC